MHVHYTELSISFLCFQVGFSNPVYASTKSPVKDNPMYESSEILKDTDPPAHSEPPADH